MKILVSLAQTERHNPADREHYVLENNNLILLNGLLGDLILRRCLMLHVLDLLLSFLSTSDAKKIKSVTPLLTHHGMMRSRALRRTELIEEFSEVRFNLCRSLNSLWLCNTLPNALFGFVNDSGCVRF